MLPPETVMSSAAKVDDASDSVKVTVSVWLDRSAVDPARVMVTVGDDVSYVMDRALDAVLSLPAVSVNVALSTEILPVPESVLAVGVNTME